MLGWLKRGTQSSYKLGVMNNELLVATDTTNSLSYPLDFATVHGQGIPHRAVHFEITDAAGKYFVWERADGRLEIPGGHVSWIGEDDRAESYDEAALRELSEELNLAYNWGMSQSQVQARLFGRLLEVTRVVNQLSSSHKKNNEWVAVYGLLWQDEWGDPRKFEFSEEGQTSAQWLSVKEIEDFSLENPMAINSALRLFLQRRGVFAPLLAESARV